MNYATVKKFDVANGVGVRVSLFVSGCTHHCEGCFNSEAWDFDYGQEYTAETEKEILDALAPSYIKGLSLLGGEPFEPQNRATVCQLAEKVKELYPEKTIWCYSGYLYDSYMKNGKHADGDTIERLLNCIDILVDGKFVESLKDLSLKFKGSSNQRIIDVKKSQKENKVILWEEDSQ